MGDIGDHIEDIQEVSNYDSFATLLLIKSDYSIKKDFWFMTRNQHQKSIKCFFFVVF